MKSAFAILIAALAQMLVLAPILAPVPARADDPPALCAPEPGQGAQYLSACESAAKSGDGVAALTTGKIFWNGDGVPKDNAQAAVWWHMADNDGQPEAAMLLGNEAFVRATKDRNTTDIPAMNEAVNWYQKAAAADPNPATRLRAQDLLDQIARFQHAMPHI